MLAAAVLLATTCAAPAPRDPPRRLHLPRLSLRADARGAVLLTIAFDLPGEGPAPPRVDRARRPRGIAAPRRVPLPEAIDRAILRIEDDALRHASGCR